MALSLKTRLHVGLAQAFGYSSWTYRLLEDLGVRMFKVLLFKPISSERRIQPICDGVQVLVFVQQRLGGQYFTTRQDASRCTMPD